MVNKIQTTPSTPYWELDPLPAAALPPTWNFLLEQEQINSSAPAGSVSTHHQLEAPRFNSGDFQCAVKEMDLHLNETVLLQLYIACMKAQRESLEQCGTLAKDHAFKQQKINRRLKEEFFNTLDEKISRSKADSVLNWVSWALWGAIAVAGVASVALTVATAGTALPTTLIVANGALAVGQGGVQITQGVLKHKNDKATGKLTELEAKRYLSSTQIRDEIDSMKYSMQIISESWQALMEVLNNQYQASSNH